MWYMRFLTRHKQQSRDLILISGIDTSGRCSGKIVTKYPNNGSSLSKQRRMTQALGKHLVVALAADHNTLPPKLRPIW